jgi:hypothetical protein
VTVFVTQDDVMTAQPEWGPSPEDGPPTQAWAPPPVADTRPWYRKLRFMVPIAAFGGLVLGSAATGASSASPSASPATTTTSTVTTTASAAPVTVTSTATAPAGKAPAATTPPAVAAVLKAWTDAGPKPDQQHAAMAALMAQWPTLAQALEKATGVKAPTSAAPQSSAPAQAGGSGTTSQEQALGSAQDYLSNQAFSKAGLIDQLSSSAGEGFSKADATWAVNHLKVNWYEEAVKSARDYLSNQHFSRSGLIEQLSSSAGEKFTRAQAIYAANKVGL